ncbi:MAG TPA: carboxylating nicotinate-nucleotide diphosphorylase [Steroidobacteraceae bacterium]|jgi:nicotinate-nucleotide pyrophosphorylase (carboxylating)
MPELPKDLGDQVATALAEDIGSGDVTARLVPETQQVRGRVITREDAVMCGQAWVDETFRRLDDTVTLDWHAQDGDRIRIDQTLFEIRGSARPVLTGERTALNFLQLLSATATQAKRFADAVRGTGCTILDTRKTIPGLRTAQKYAVLCGGAQNLRIGLYDMVLIKENHIAAAGSIGGAISAAKQSAPDIRIEVEVESLAGLEEALASGPDVVMLDNFSIPETREAVEFTRTRRPGVMLEASGNVSLDNVRAIAESGVDYISVGGITKNIRAVDLSMRLEFTG